MLVRISRGGSKYIIDFMISAVSECAGSGRKSAGAGPGPAQHPALGLDILGLDILTSIQLHILPCPYLM